MIRIKVEEQEEEETTLLPIESENWNNVGGSTTTTSDTNNGNVFGTLKESPLKSPEMNGEVLKKVVVPKKKKKSKKSKQLDNSTTDFVAVGSKSIKTEPVESSLSLTTQLNHSLNIQSLLKQNRIQNEFRTTNEQSIPNGTQQQQQQQSLLSIKIEPIIPEINQEIPLSLDLSSLISNLISEQSVNYDTAEIPSLVQSSSWIRNGTQQQQQSLLLTKIEPIDSEIHSKEVPLSLDQSSSSIPNLNSGESTTATNCDTDTTEFSDPRAGLGRRAKLNVCYSVPKEPKDSVSRRRKKKVSEKLPPPPLLTPEPQTTITATIQRNSAGNSESTNNNYNYSDQDYTFSGSGPIFGVDSSISTSTGPPSLPPEATAVPLLVGKKPLKKEYSLLLYHRKKKKANPKIEQQPLDSEVRAEKLRRKRDYNRKWKQQVMANATPEQREQRRLKHLEYVRQQREKESEERRQRRLEQKRHYNRTLGKQRIRKLLANATPEQRELRRVKDLEKVKRQLDKESEEQRQRRLERKREYNRTVGKQRREQVMANATPEQREQRRLKHLEEVRRQRENESEEQRQQRLERVRQYNQKRKQQLLDSSGTPRNNGGTLI